LGARLRKHGTAKAPSSPLYDHAGNNGRGPRPAEIEGRKGMNGIKKVPDPNGPKLSPNRLKIHE
jgi:hypothetical protein